MRSSAPQTLREVQWPQWLGVPTGTLPQWRWQTSQILFRRVSEDTLYGRHTSPLKMADFPDFPEDSCRIVFLNRGAVRGRKSEEEGYHYGIAQFKNLAYLLS